MSVRQAVPTVLIVLVVLIGATGVAAQESLHRAAIQGTWTISFAAGGNPNQSVQERSNEGRPPLRPQYREIWDARRAATAEANARGQPLATAATFCLPQGMPSMMGSGGPFPMEVLVSDGQVTIIQEAYNQVRRIYMNRPQLPLADIEPGFYGRSVGHWEGDVLVVDTIGIKETVEFRDVPHSAAMRVVERISLVAPDVLRDVVTLEDPQVLEQPWTVTFMYNRLPDYEMMEYVCEDNREYADENGATRLRVH